MEKAQLLDMLEYYETHKGEAFIYGIYLVKLLSVDRTKEDNSSIIVYDVSLRGTLKLNIETTHLVQLKCMIDDDDYSEIVRMVDQSFIQYLRNQEYETQSR